MPRNKDQDWLAIYPLAKSDNRKIAMCEEASVSPQAGRVLWDPMHVLSQIVEAFVLLARRLVKLLTMRISIQTILARIWSAKIHPSFKFATQNARPNRARCV